MPDVSHEVAVAAFMAEAKSRDPELYASVCYRHRVLSERQMARRSSRELPLLPADPGQWVPRTSGRNGHRPGNRSPEFWAAYYAFELEKI